MADLAVVKPDPEAVDGPSPMSVVDDPFEDHDLEFYSPLDPSGNPTPQHTLLMVRVPTYVWAAWDKIDDDTPVEIGKMRIWSEPDKKYPHAMTERTRLLLKSGVPAHQGLPREYDLYDTNKDVTNTFLFSETDLDAFKKKNKIRRDAASQNIPSYLLRKKADAAATTAPREPRGSRRNRKDTFRQVIPKKTAVYGRVRREANMNPIDNPETAYLMAIRAQEQIKPKHTTALIDRIEITDNIVQAGTQQANAFSEGFMKNTKAEKSTKKARAEAKTARIPENELLDKIFQAFREYNYWSLKALKAAIPQPEVYLKTTLEQIATMNKTGRFASQWCLKSGFIAHAEAAPEAQTKTDDEDEDDEDVKMEDVA